MRDDDAARAGDFESQVTGVAALREPIRRALYRFVVDQGEPVNRDQAAASLAVPRHVARFHLDRMVEDGLLDVHYARPPGRVGPGAGRPAKLYSRSRRELSVSLPPRAYDLAGRLLAEGITRAERENLPVSVALHDTARDVGRSLGRLALQRAGPRPRRAELVAAATSALGECGYEPRSDRTGVTLANCPFHVLAQQFRDLVCGMNLHLLTGLVDSVEGCGLEAHLEPTEGQCCVRLTPRPAASN